MEKNEGYIYLLKMLDDKGQSVYKIGRSKNIDDRMKNYKFKECIFTLKNDNYKDLENKLIRLLTLKYSIATGREYFYCTNENELIDYIISNIKKEDINDKIYSTLTNHVKILEEQNNEKYNIITNLHNELTNKNLILSKLIEDINEINEKNKNFEDLINNYNIKIKKLEDLINHNNIDNKNIKNQKKNIDYEKVSNKCYYECKNCNYKTIYFKDIKKHFNKIDNCIEVYNEKYKNYSNDHKIILSLLPHNENNEQSISYNDLLPDYNNKIFLNKIKLINRICEERDNNKTCYNCNKNFNKNIELRKHILSECFIKEINDI